MVYDIDIHELNLKPFKDLKVFGWNFSKKVTNSEPSIVKSNLQKLQAVKKVTKSEKGQQK
jgi:hypothetical protein